MNATQPTEGRSRLAKLAAAVRYQFSFTGTLRRRWQTVVLTCLFVLAIPPLALRLYVARQRAIAAEYCLRINAQLPNDPRFRDVQAVQPMKGSFGFVLTGSVRSKADFKALVQFIETTDPPKPYNLNGALILPDK